MKLSYVDIVYYLESLQIMPKTMPGLNKIKRALLQTDWYNQIDSSRVIVVAGTNGKGTTCAALEALLIEAGCSVGFYSSPHLISTTERIRYNSSDVSESTFISLYEDCKDLIKSCELSHFESLTLMACHYYFSGKIIPIPDYVLLEVGLGGTFDATNAIPHKYSVITSLSLDHTNILGSNLLEIARNKFGIVGRKNIVVHHSLQPELQDLKNRVRKETNSNWIESEKSDLVVQRADSGLRYFFKYNNELWPTNMQGERALQNIMTAITVFQTLGFDLRAGAEGLTKVRWPGRMQQVKWVGLKSPLFLSGDHNEDGVRSLIKLLQDYTWDRLYLIVGIGADKDAESMLAQLLSLPRVSLCLTETSFKPKKISDYSEVYLQASEFLHADVSEVLRFVASRAQAKDLCVVTGSLYLVGKVLSELKKN